MARRHKHQSLGVDWTLPNKKRRFTTTTKATSDLINLIATDNPTLTVEQAITHINYDPEAQQTLQYLSDNGYSTTLLSELVQTYK